MVFKKTLCEAELVVLRDYAETVVIDLSGERLRSFDPERNGGQSSEELQAEAHQEMVAAADVLGALRNEELTFSDLGTGRSTPEAVEVSFTEQAMEWLSDLYAEIREGLEQSRGTIEINLNSAPTRTFLFYVLEGICEGVPAVSSGVAA